MTNWQGPFTTPLNMKPGMDSIFLLLTGPTSRVPDEYEIINYFGAWNSSKGKKPCPKARVSQMFDVLNKVTIDASIAPKKQGERELASFHFLKLLPQDLHSSGSWISRPLAF